MSRSRSVVTLAIAWSALWISGECFVLQSPSFLAQKVFAGIGIQKHRLSGFEKRSVGLDSSFVSSKSAAIQRNALSTRLKMGVKNIITYPVRVAILGGGNFGLCLAVVLGNKNIPVTILVRKDNVATSINTVHRHPTFLSDVTLPLCVTATTDPAVALTDAAYIIHAVPVQFSRAYLRSIKPYVGVDTPIICTSKGIESGTLTLMKDILYEELGEHRELAFLSGPSFAREIATGLATAVVVASHHEGLSKEVAALFSGPTFRVFTSRDVIGVEIGGAVKNVVAIAAGMCEGLGLGTNSMAGLVTRGCLEMNTLARALGAKPSTLMGLSGVGDTFGTCFGPLSRNRNLGIRLGQGEKLEDILSSSSEVAEGYATSLSLVDFIDKKLTRSFRKDLKFPILYGVAAILRGQRTPREGLTDLMQLPLRTEIFDNGAYKVVKLRE